MEKNNQKENEHNIFFSFEEKDNNQCLTEEELQKMINELDNVCNDNNCNDNTCFINDAILDEAYYSLLTLKELIKISQYYGLDKLTKKFKKSDYVELIIGFESIHDNYDIVERRIRFWAYMNELKNDPYMKKFLLWD